MVRFFPAAARAQATENTPRAAAVSEAVSKYVAPRIDPAVAARAEPAPGLVPPRPPEVPAETRKTPVRARRRAQFPAPAMGPAYRPQPNHALRVTGGEPEAAVAMPASSTVARQPAEGSEALAPRMDWVTAPEEARPAVPVTAPELAATLQDAAPEKPRNGNRIVKALGRVNPFRKRAKPAEGEAGKTPLRKD